jgi:Legionella pneumophila major outer membrane protein precursor
MRLKTPQDPKPAIVLRMQQIPTNGGTYAKRQMRPEIAPRYSPIAGVGLFIEANHFGGAMKSIVSTIGIAAIVLATNSAALAESNESARIAALEKENAQMHEQNALMRKEIEELRQGQKRLERASSARSSELTSTPTQPSAMPARPARSKRSPLDAYAMPAPLPFKAPIAPEARGRFTVWGEGGATFTGGDPSLLFYTPVNLSGTSSPQPFDLTPKLGWEGAAGFDYRFANSPWHVSGQFRYGEGIGRDWFANSQTLGQTGIVNISSTFDTQTIAAEGKERHWLADLTVGKDVLGSGPEAMQVKGGLRVSEFRVSTSSLEVDNGGLVFTTPQTVNGVTFTTLGVTTVRGLVQEARFLGAGPVIGVEGSVPFAPRWTFEYAGDAAALFGKQRYSQVQGGFGITTPVMIPVGSIPNFANFNEQNATVFNADLQFGVSYWVTPQVKVTGSYRLDAYLNVVTGLSPANDFTKLQTLDRYIHGPRVGMSATF